MTPIEFFYLRANIYICYNTLALLSSFRVQNTKRGFFGTPCMFCFVLNHPFQAIWNWKKIRKFLFNFFLKSFRNIWIVKKSQKFYFFFHFFRLPPGYPQDLDPDPQKRCGSETLFSQNIALNINFGEQKSLIYKKKGLGNIFSNFVY